MENNTWNKTEAQRKINTWCLGWWILAADSTVEGSPTVSTFLPCPGDCGSSLSVLVIGGAFSWNNISLVRWNKSKTQQKQLSDLWCWNIGSRSNIQEFFICVHLSVIRKLRGTIICSSLGNDGASIIIEQSSSLLHHSRRFHYGELIWCRLRDITWSSWGIYRRYFMMCWTLWKYESIE